MSIGFRVCGDRSPSGLHCNRGEHGTGTPHAFSRNGEPVATWAAAPVRDERHDRLAEGLRAWWLGLAEQEVKAVAPKAVEYGATDLRDIGRDLAASAGREVSDEEATELGIYFYMRGKLSRWTDAVIRGDRPSDDTLHDLGVYVRMAQRTRSHGGWPGFNKEDAK